MASGFITSWQIDGEQWQTLFWGASKSLQMVTAAMKLKDAAPWKRSHGTSRQCIQFSSVQSLSPVRLFATPRIAARQASLSIINSQSSLRLTSIESVMPSSHLILCHPFLLLPLIPPSIRIFSNESTLHMRWPNYWSFSFSIIPSKVYISSSGIDKRKVERTLKTYVHLVNFHVKEQRF